MEHRPYAGDRALELVLGEPDQVVLNGLARIDSALHDWAEALRRRAPQATWWTRGLQIAEYPGPPRKACLQAYVEGPVCFCLELARGDLAVNWKQAGLNPGAFYVEAQVYVDPPPSAPHHDPQWLVFELAPTEHASARAVVAALAAAVPRLREESERRDPTEDAWWPAQ